MTEKQLQRGWWWREDKAWDKIAKADPGYQGQTVPAEVVKLEYERSAFYYEAQARGPIPAKAKPVAYPLGVPYPDLSPKDIVGWKKRFLSQAWRNAGGIGSRRPGVKLAHGELSLDGIIITPGKTTPGLFQRAIVEQVNRMMRDQNLKWGKAEYNRKKPWPWDHLENADRFTYDLPLKERDEMINAEAVMRGTLRDYGKP